MTSPALSSPPSSAPSGSPRLKQHALDRLVAARATGLPAVIRSAEQHVVLTHMAMTSAWARRYRNKGLETADLEHVAHLGLVKAVRGGTPACPSCFLRSPT